MKTISLKMPQRNVEETLQVISFFYRNRNVLMMSTSATTIDVTDDVYNVSGSTKDPKIGNKSWKRLLKSHGINHECYVTNQVAPIGKSHPCFSVGGHVTKDSSGFVKIGDDSYLMPLCYWHNSTRRDGLPFEHHEKRMLKLEGFMMGDNGITFEARLWEPGDEATRMLFLTEEGWQIIKLNEEQYHKLNNSRSFDLNVGSNNVDYIVIRRSAESERFSIDFASENLNELFLTESNETR